MRPTVQRRSCHDRDRVLTQVAVTIAGGGRRVSDLGVLRDQPALFGEVASDATAWRVFDAVDEDVLERIRQAREHVTAGLLERLGPPTSGVGRGRHAAGDPLGEQAGAAAHFKGGYGFAPILVFAEPVGCPWLSGCARASPPPTTLPERRLMPSSTPACSAVNGGGGHMVFHALLLIGAHQGSGRRPE